MCALSEGYYFQTALYGEMNQSGKTNQSVLRRVFFCNIKDKQYPSESEFFGPKQFAVL